MRLGVIGYGAIGGAVVDAWRQGGLGPRVEIAAVLVQRPRPAEPDLVVTHEAERFFAQPQDVVLECAGHDAVRAYGVRCLEHGADLVLTSIGALVDEVERDRLYAAAEATGRRLVLASAGIGALDILAGAAVGGLDRVAITVRKDPSAWWGTEAEGLCDLARLAEPYVLYRGPVPATGRSTSAASLPWLPLMSECASHAPPPPPPWNTWTKRTPRSTRRRAAKHCSPKDLVSGRSMP
jgi:aspartate dehydrogenase